MPVSFEWNTFWYEKVTLGSPNTCIFQLLCLSQGSVLTTQMEGWTTETLQQFLTENVALQVWKMVVNIFNDIDYWETINISMHFFPHDYLWIKSTGETCLVEQI